MREKPELWKAQERIQWGCALMSMLGEDSLEHLHLVLAGLRAVERSQQVSSHEGAVQTARVILGDLLTRNAVQSAVYDFLSSAASRSYSIDPKTLKFTTEYADGLDPSISKAEHLLNSGMAREAYKFELADPDKDLVVEINDDESRIPIRLSGLRFPAIQQHDLTRRPSQPIHVRVAEMVDLAEQLDQQDRDAHRPSLGWSARVRILLQVTSGNGLRDTDVLELSGLKHLIGLPGAGKTTLITLLCVLLKRRGQRVAVFFTSIEVARQYLATLRRYGLSVALLMGRSGPTHLQHANRMAELIAGQGDGGFGHTREGIELFATSCPLPAFADSWPNTWRLGEAPCQSVYEADSSSRKLCPAWELCGRVKNQRALVKSDVWLGHVLSADTYVPAHTSPERLRYFELIAETFDLVVFDECDETQNVLDEQGAVTLTLTGDENSLHIRLQKMTGLLAANNAHVSDGMLRYILQSNEFERHMLRFLSAIRQFNQNKRTQKIANQYADKLLTANFLIREALIAAGTRKEFDSKALSAISDFWERAMYRAFFFRGEERDTRWAKAEKHAPDLNLDVEDANERWLRINRALKRYLALDHAAEADEIVDEIAGELARLFHASSPDIIREQVRLLIAVGFTVASYQRLAKSARPLASRGEISNELFFAKVSPEMRELVPRSLLGTFSAVRYRRAPESKGFEIDYLVMDSTPRLLLHRLSEFGRANVLLASATSWLEASTKYHVDKKPDYVLLPRSNEIGSVRLYLLPKTHPSTRKPLRFSGAGDDREDNLRHMVTSLAQVDVDGLCELQKAVQSVTTELGRRRMAALIVNSYEQVRMVVEQLHEVNPTLGERTRGVVDVLPKGVSRARYALKGQVEEIGRDEDIDVVVFPIASLGRGINIVISSDDDDDGKAAIGSIYFLTRPHPAAGDLGLMTSMLARATQEINSRDFRHLPLADVRKIYDRSRYQIYRRVANLLARPMSASRLDQETLTNFAANLLVPILQTIGRGMRKRMPVAVYFVDAAWAPNSAEGRPESERSSVLVAMRQILEECVAHTDPDLRDVHRALYGIFRDAFSDIVGLIPPQSARGAPDELFDPSPATGETDFDGYDPLDLAEEAGAFDGQLSPDAGVGDEYYEDEEIDG